ncbi:MAG: PAS domain-containing protein [Thermoanaerobaculia bacterium]
MKKILIGIKHKENQKLLKGLLKKDFKIETIEKFDFKKIDFDLIILDGQYLKEFKKEIIKIKKSVYPLFLPLLLLTSRKDLKISQKNLWKVVDDLITLPTEKIELECRIKNLLMARNLSLKLKEILTSNIRAILYSIGDGVISTDKEGKVQLMNSVAESLTGWKEEEARGKHLDDIFKIVNEYTRKKAENPIKRVLKEGVIVGLANHSILISKDGREIPIADAGSPVLDYEGKIIGAVFVFRDQTKERNLQKEIEEAKKFSEGILETMREPLLVLNDKLEIVYANKAFYNIFKIKEDILGEKIYNIGNKEWDIPELKKLLEETELNLHYINPNNFSNFKELFKELINQLTQLR